jgi:hypothetical protein
VLYERFHYRNLNFKNLLYWADKIDSASFSLEELMSSKETPLKIHLSLGIEADNAYLIELSRLFLYYKDELLSPRTPLPSIVKWRFEMAKKMQTKVIEEFKEKAIFDPRTKVVFFSLSKYFLLCRWAPYYFYPDCLYVVGVLNMQNGHYMVIVNANPWQSLDCSINIGKICSAYGGGGHANAGGINLSTSFEAQRVAQEIFSFLKTTLSSDKD